MAVDQPQQGKQTFPRTRTLWCHTTPAYDTCQMIIGINEQTVYQLIVRNIK